MLETEGLRAWAEVDYSAIPHNIEEVRKLCPNEKIIGIVKADAYGHGALKCTQEMQKCGVDFFAVAALDEALELRQGGVEDDILILGWTPEARLDELADNRLIQTIVSLDYARKLSEYARKTGKTIRGHVKLDTGMNRTGILYQEGQKDFDQLLEVYALPGLQLEGIFSHFPVSDDLEEEAVTFTKRQMQLFDEAIDRLKEQGIDPGIRHIQNSYGILNYMDAGYDYCRPGLLYMGVTSDDAVPIASSPDFIPILSLKARVTMIKTIPDGATVSYGRHYKAKGPRQIASLSIGYADGLPRTCSNQNLPVLINGQKAYLAGNICMDQCMADITGLEGIQEGDIVTLIGKDGDETLTVDAISRAAGTINNETLTRLTKRVPRIEINRPEV